MRRGLLLALLCVLTPAAWAQGVRYDNVAFATGGVRLPNPTVSVSATVYTNSTLTTAAANPLPIVAIGQTFSGAGVDAAGNYGFWVAPGRYTLTISSQGITPFTMTVTLPCDSTVTSCSLGSVSASAVSVSGQITSTVGTGTAPFSITSTTVTPNLNAQLHNGKTAPTGNIVGDSDSQTLTSKTIDCTANTLAKTPCVVYSTASTSTNASIGATTMATPASNATYFFTFAADVTALGTSCSGNSNISVSLTFTDPNAGSPQTIFVTSVSMSITGNGTLGNALQGNGFNQTIRAKASTSVQYSTTFTPGTGCSPAPSYQIYPVLEQLQ